MSAFKDAIIEALQPLPPEFVSFCTKVIACMFYIAIGILALVGDRLRKNKSVRDWKFFGTILLAIAIGSLSCSFAMANFPTKVQYITPICTLFSEKIFMLLAEWVERKFKSTIDNEETK